MICIIWTLDQSPGRCKCILSMDGTPYMESQSQTLWLLTCSVWWTAHATLYRNLRARHKRKARHATGVAFLPALQREPSRNRICTAPWTGLTRRRGREERHFGDISSSCPKLSVPSASSQGLLPSGAATDNISELDGGGTASRWHPRHAAERRPSFRCSEATAAI